MRDGPWTAKGVGVLVLLTLFVLFLGSLLVDGGAGCGPQRDPGLRVGGVDGVAHYYPLTESSVHGSMVCDAAGDADGTVDGDVRFGSVGALFDGGSEVVLPHRADFSAAGNRSGALTVVAVVRIDGWGGGNPTSGEYVHWLGKGRDGAQEWTFRHYTDDADDRSRRVSFYAFNPEGGLGAGSYFTGDDEEMVVVGVLQGTADDGGTTQIWLDGVLQDRDRLSQYDVVPQDTGSPVVLGSRGDGTGFLKGRLRDVVFFDRALDEQEIGKVSAALQ